jgi:hypothetical protein
MIACHGEAEWGSRLGCRAGGWQIRNPQFTLESTGRAVIQNSEFKIQNSLLGRVGGNSKFKIQNSKSEIRNSKSGPPSNPTGGRAVIPNSELRIPNSAPILLP